MRALLPLLLLSATLAVPAVADAPEMVRVALDATILGLDHAACEVVVPRNATGGDALDAAVASGCLAEWTAGSYPGFGRYVVSIDDVEGNALTYWALEVNGVYSEVGIDGLRLQDGDEVRFDYRCWVIEPYLP